MEAALVELVLESNERTLPYTTVAASLGVSEQDVEVIVLKALDAGVISGRVDAEYEHLVIDASRKPEVTREKVRQAVLGLDKLDSQLTAELDTRKRSRNALDDSTSEHS